MTRSLALLAVVSSLAACSSSSSSTTGATVGSMSSTGATTSATVTGTTGAATAAASTSGATGQSSTATTSSGAVSGTTGTGATTGGTSSTTGTTSGTTGALTAETYAQDLNQLYCNFAVSCGGYASYVNALCAGGLIVLYDPGTAAEAVDAGRVSFDLTQAATCLNAFADAGCSNVLLGSVVDNVCLRVLTGLLPADAGCFSNTDCQSDSCSSNGCTPGLCASMSEVGGACDCAGPGCGACDPAGDLTCINNICLAPSGLGATCGTGTTAPCGAGLACIDSTCASIPVALGSPCTVNEGECILGSYCLAAVEDQTGTCVTTAAANQPCAQDAEHLPNAIGGGDPECQTPGFVCLGAGVLVDGGFASGTCTASSDEGSPCTLPSSVIDAGAPYVNGCKTGLNCVSGTCTRPPSSGTCSPLQDECDITLAYCNSMTNTCEPPVALGGDCTNAQCVSNATCGTNDVCSSECVGTL